MSWLSNKFSKFSQEGKSKDSKKIICPHCQSVQEVSTKAELTFCKECKKIINARKAETAAQETAEEIAQAEQAPVEKPVEEKPREYREYKEPQKPAFRISEEEDSSVPKSAINDIRNVKCSYCHTTQEVPAIALSSFCKKCGHRINLQDYEIRGKFQGDLDTRGTIFLSEDSDVKANINVGSAVVRGKIQGTIIAEIKVELMPTGKIFGKIIAPNFVVHEGAIFVGRAEIDPSNVATAVSA